MDLERTSVNVFYLNFIGLQKIFNHFGGEWLKTQMRMAATKMSRAETQRRKEMFLFFTVKIHPPHPDPLPPLGGEGMIFMIGGDQIPVMMVCDSNSGVRH
jgi:hypothetical protein